MSGDGNAASTHDLNKGEMETIDPASGSKVSKESNQSEAKENLNRKSELNFKKEFPSEEKEEMPEMKNLGKPMMGLPPINVNELTTILQNPDMPSQTLMKEIAQKIKTRNEENESNAKSVNNVNPLGIKSVFDCIMEVTLTHSDNSSDEEEEDEHKPHILEIPCDYCKKIFGSTMSLKTHVLMSHSQNDPSVLNIIRLRSSIDEDKSYELSSKKDEGLKKGTEMEMQDQGVSKSGSLSPGISIGQGALLSKPSSLAERTVSEDCCKQDLLPKLSDSDEIPKHKSPKNSGLASTPVPSKSTRSRSSLQNRKLRAETEKNPDLKDAAIKTAEAHPPPSSQDTSTSEKSGKRKSDDTSISSNKIKSKRSRVSMSGNNETKSVQLRRSSRKK